MKKFKKTIAVFILIICGFALALSINKNALPYPHSLELSPNDNNQEVITITNYDNFDEYEKQDELLSNPHNEENNIINIDNEEILDQTIDDSIDTYPDNTQSGQDEKTISIIDIDDEDTTKETITYRDEKHNDNLNVIIDEKELKDNEVKAEKLDDNINNINNQSEKINNDKVLIDSNNNSISTDQQTQNNTITDNVATENNSIKQLNNHLSEIDTLEFDKNFINNMPVYTQKQSVEKSSSPIDYLINTLELETNRLFSSQNYELEIISEGTISVLPDNAEIFVEINYIDMVEKVCEDNAQTLLDNTKAYLESVGITNNDINIYSNNIYPVYRVNNAYKANIYFSIKVSNLSSLETILNGLENDYVKVSSINYCTSNSDELCNKALAVAIENAFTKANEISGSQNLTLIQAEEEYCFGPCQMYKDYCKDCISDNLSTPIEISSSVRATFIVNE